MPIADAKQAEFAAKQVEINTLFARELPNKVRRNAIENYLADVRSLIMATNNFDALRESLRFGYGALLKLQFDPPDISQLREFVRVQEAAGTIAPVTSGALNTAMDALEHSLKSGQFKDVGHKFGDVLRIIETHRHRGLDPYVADELNGFMHYMLTFVSLKGTAETEQHYAVSADAGGVPRVRVLSVNGEVLFSFFAYDPGFTGGVRIAMGDINNDGAIDVITAPGPGGGPHVRVFDGITGQPMAGAIGNFLAYAPNFTGGVYVASADVNRDGHDDVITGAGAGGGPHVRVFSGVDGRELTGFLAYSPVFTGGVHVAAGDVDGDGYSDIITGAGAGGGPHVLAYSGSDGTVLRSCFAYDPGFNGGVYVAAGDFNGDLRADIVTGTGARGGPHVIVYDGQSVTPLHSVFPYDPGFLGGVRVAAADLDNDGLADIITAAGRGGGPHVRGLSGQSLAEVTGLLAFDPAFTGGVFVAGQIRNRSPETLRLAAEARLASNSVPALRGDDLSTSVEAAIERWSGAGLPAIMQQRLWKTRVEIADLPRDLLGLAASDRVTIDLNAAGQGWFIDPSPMADEEFMAPEALESRVDGVDLLTVVLHEFGHHLGLEDLDTGVSDELMSDTLESGVRRLPSVDLLDALFATT